MFTSMSENTKKIMNEGVSLGEKGDFLGAIKYFKKILENDKNHLYAWMFAAKSWESLGRGNSNAAQEAIHYYDEVIRIDKSNPEGWFGKGVVLVSYLNKPDESFDCFTKTLELKKNI